MFSFLGCISIFLLQISFSIGSDPDKISTLVIVPELGYPLEVHEVTTEDGYILALHRIPSSPKANNSSGKPIVFLQHGLGGDSTNWVFLRNEALAFALADRGYDVWMGNVRGTRYSEKHEYLSKYSPKFWDYSFDEMGKYDIPAMVNYALSHTGKEKLHYVGHSQGTISFFIASILDEDFQSKIISSHLLAPIAYLNNTESVVLKIFSVFIGGPNGLSEIFGSVNVIPNNRPLRILGSDICLKSSPIKKVCYVLYYLITGWGSPYVDKSTLSDVVASLGSYSLKDMSHFAQLARSGYFRPYDYGLISNLLNYGTPKPPSYQLENIDTSPIYLYHSDLDYFADTRDVARLSSELNPEVLKSVYLVPCPGWSHTDFVFGINATQCIYNKVIEDISANSES